MAFREVQGSKGGQFIKFSNIGDTQTGRLTGSHPSTGTFAQQKIDQGKDPGTDYTFEGVGGETGLRFTISATMDLADKLAKCKIGDLVQMTYEADKPNKKPGFKPVKVFEVLVDE